MALDVDVEIVFPLTGFGRTGLEARHRHAMVLQGNQQVVNGTGSVGHRDHQTGAVFARSRRGGHGLWQTDHGKAGAVVGFVLDGVSHRVQAKLGGSPFAGDAGPIGLSGGQSSAFGVAADRTSFGVGQVLAEPALALGQGLRVGQNHFDAFHGVALAQQVVAHQKAD